VRAGGALYGLPSSATLAEHATDLRPAMRLTTRVVHRQLVVRGETVSYGQLWKASRPTYVATIPVGYGDGVPRSLSNRGLIGIRGKLYPVAGRVCMDMMMLDLGAVGDAGEKVQVGDEAVIFGAGGPSAFEQANRSGTMAYVMTTGLLPRVPRVYHRGASE
jgi:alanine racemase